MTRENIRLLVISNNVLSQTKSNGKTMASFLDALRDSQVRQLYFYNEYPDLGKYAYFRITDQDILKGRLLPKNRGHAMPNSRKEGGLDCQIKKKDTYGNALRLIREIAWWGGWKSSQLLQWLNEYKPNTIFFHGGDCLFGYDICRYVQERYHARLILFITDDYIMPRLEENAIGRLRRGAIYGRLKRSASEADLMVTISEKMRMAYRKVLDKDSIVALNTPFSMKDESLREAHDGIRLVYAGTTYWGREKTLQSIARTLEKVSAGSSQRMSFAIFSNDKIGEELMDTLNKSKTSFYGGNLNAQQLKEELNRSDILVYAESFEKGQAEKIRYSLSTKIPEYLSLRKPIFAVGPRESGSMSYLSDAAFCVYSEDGEIEEDGEIGIEAGLRKLLGDLKLQSTLAEKAEEKFRKNHDKSVIGPKLAEALFGHKGIVR